MSRFDYMGGYVDRRMNNLIDEWNLATRTDLGDLYTRLYAIEEEVRSSAAFEAVALAKVAELERRIEVLKGMRK